MSENNQEDEVMDSGEPICEPRKWRDMGWQADVIKNEDDDGWAVAMTRIGESEPALVGPWTMGRDKKNPKPLDRSAFHTLVKTANEFVGRLRQQRDEKLNKEIAVGKAPDRIFVRLSIDPDEDFPSATLTAFDESRNKLGSLSVEASFKLSADSAQRFIDSGFERA